VEVKRTLALKAKKVTTEIKKAKPTTAKKTALKRPSTAKRGSTKPAEKTVVKAATKTIKKGKSTAKPKQKEVKKGVFVSMKEIKEIKKFMKHMGTKQAGKKGSKK
jgi:hypothetical protein